MSHEHSITCLEAGPVRGQLVCRKTGQAVGASSKAAREKFAHQAEIRLATVDHPEARSGKVPDRTIWIGPRAVRRSQIIGTRHLVYTVWEPTSSGARGYLWGHSSLSTVDGRRMGRLGTQNLPAEIDALPAMSDVRYKASDDFHEVQYQRAYRFIEDAFPETRGVGMRRSGEITSFFR